MYTRPRLTERPFLGRLGLEQTIKLAAFTKNMALVGSALMFLAIPAPWAYCLSLGRGAQNLAPTQAVAAKEPPAYRTP